MPLFQFIMVEQEVPMSTRRKFRQSVPLADRLAVWANDVRAEMEKLSPNSPERDKLLKKIEQANAALQFEAPIAVR